MTLDRSIDNAYQQGYKQGQQDQKEKDAVTIADVSEEWYKKGQQDQIKRDAEIARKAIMPETNEAAQGWNIACITIASEIAKLYEPRNKI